MVKIFQKKQNKSHAFSVQVGIRLAWYMTILWNLGWMFNIVLAPIIYCVEIFARGMSRDIAALSTFGSTCPC